ncbi:hypothetical protein [Paenibacillus naphthalenovorans]|uniref:hypothetical protein n=1 Tax=Paenibacillus naphthalenovorans TaxID=162209 RepID=UPI003D2D0390
MKIELDVWSGGRREEPYLTSDKFGRFRMSAGLVEMVGAKDTAISVFIAYDKANKRVALGKPGVVKPTDSKPVTFDRGRHYGNVRGFMRKHQLPFESVQYVYDGKYDGWMMFRRADYVAPDGRGTD